MLVSANNLVSSSKKFGCRFTARSISPLDEPTTYYCSDEVKLNSNFEVMCLYMNEFFNAGTHEANLNTLIKVFTFDLITLKRASF